MPQIPLGSTVIGFNVALESCRGDTGLKNKLEINQPPCTEARLHTEVACVPLQKKDEIMKKNNQNDFLLDKKLCFIMPQQCVSK